MQSGNGAHADRTARCSMAFSHEFATASRQSNAAENDKCVAGIGAHHAASWRHFDTMLADTQCSPLDALAGLAQLTAANVNVLGRPQRCARVRIGACRDLQPVTAMSDGPSDVSEQSPS